MRAPLIPRQGQQISVRRRQRLRRGHAVHRVRMAPLAMRWSATSPRSPSDLQRKKTVASEEPTPSAGAVPNLRANGSAGIAVGMATNIPPATTPARGREGAQWPWKPRQLARGARTRRTSGIKGQDSPTERDSRGVRGIERPTGTGADRSSARGSSRSTEDNMGVLPLDHRLPYMSTPDNLAH